MALQQKLIKETGLFVPSYPEGLRDPSVRKGQKWDSFKRWLMNIKWSKLNDEEFRQQWGACLNAINIAENDGLVDREDFMGDFHGFLKVMKYNSEQTTILMEASDNFVTFSIVSKAYLLMRGNVDHPGCNVTVRWIKAQLQRVLDRYKPDVVTVESVYGPKRDFIGELQGLEDERDDVDFVEFFRSNGVTKEYMARVEELFQPRLAELQEAIKGKDEQLKEAFRCYTRKEMQAMAAWYEKLLEACNEYRQRKPRQPRAASVRKARVAKDKPASKLVQRMQYMASDKELKVTSIDPQKIIGANQVWLYSTKYMKLMVYYAEKDKALSVKGTSLVNWNPETSIQKRLRNPTQQLAEFMQLNGRIAVREYMGALRGGGQPNRGRMREDILILRVL